MGSVTHTHGGKCYPPSSAYTSTLMPSNYKYQLKLLYYSNIIINEIKIENKKKKGKGWKKPRMIYHANTIFD